MYAIAPQLRVGRPLGLHARPLVVENIILLENPRPVLSRKHTRLLLVVDPVSTEHGRGARFDLHATTPVSGDVVPLIGAATPVINYDASRSVPAQAVANHHRRRALLNLEAAPRVVDNIVVLEHAEAMFIHPYTEGSLIENTVMG
eukprot:scaffold6609_cov34-Tisochrysis_lutea.AAC.6